MPQLHRPQVLNSRVAKVVSTTMWFWIMYRGYHDLPHMIVRSLAALRPTPPRPWMLHAALPARVRAPALSDGRSTDLVPTAQYLHQPWEHGDHPPDLSDEDDVFLANLKAQTAK